MRRLPRTLSLYLPIFFVALLAATAHASEQSTGSSGSVSGFVTDSTGAAIPGASVTVSNSVSGLNRQTKTDATGHYQVINLPLNTYNVSVAAAGFANTTQQAAVSSFVPLVLNVKLNVSETSTEIEVDAAPTVISDPTFHTDIDRASFDKLPLESASSALSSLVTLSSPGVAADSNGLFHGLGDHASNSFSIDGQPITDQQSKVFSNQLPSNSVQSLEVIDGAPPAEYGGKTSLVIQVTTRSGQGVTKPTGSVTTSYGTFGSATGGVDLAYGGENWGNFIEVDGLNTGRFLDPPEFAVFHDKGNELNFFDRVDRQLTDLDSVHLNLNVSRSWFQTPNTYDNLDVQNVVSAGTTATPVFGGVGNTDQRSKIVTFNIAPTYTRTISAELRLQLRRLHPPRRLQLLPQQQPARRPRPHPERVHRAAALTHQRRRPHRLLLRQGRQQHQVRRAVHADLPPRERPARHRQLHLQLTLRRCHRQLAAGLQQSPAQCTAIGGFANTAYISVLAPYDLTRGGSSSTLLRPHRRQGTRPLRPGPDQDRQLALQPRHPRRPLQRPRHRPPGRAPPRRLLHHQAHRHRPARLLRPHPGVALQREPRPLQPGLRQRRPQRRCSHCTPGVSTTLQPGFRNEFHAGLQQAFGKHFVFSGDYIWKYTHNAFDFSVLGNTPITFPIDWHNAKIPGFALRARRP